MADNQTSRSIRVGYSPVKVTLAGIVAMGDPVGYNSGWKAADANASIYGELVAGQSGFVGQVITCYRAALVSGFTGLTAGATLYLSDTVGQYSTSAGTVSQKVGFAVSATEAWIEPKYLAMGVSGAGQVAVTDLAVPKVNALVSQSLAFGAFTDNAGTATGFIDFTSDLPIGAIPLGWKAVVSTGFTGDTTAVVQVGIDGDVDRFSADTTQSVLAAGSVASVALAVDAAKGFAAAVTPRVTVTGGADFTSIAAGVMVVTIYYIQTV